MIAKETGLKPVDQKLLFRGKEMDDHEHLHIAGGVKANAKVILIENLPTQNEDLETLIKLKKLTKKLKKLKKLSRRYREGLRLLIR